MLSGPGKISNGVATFHILRKGMGNMGSHECPRRGLRRGTGVPWAIGDLAHTRYLAHLLRTWRALGRQAAMAAIRRFHAAGCVGELFLRCWLLLGMQASTTGSLAASVGLDWKACDSEAAALATDLRERVVTILPYCPAGDSLWCGRPWSCMVRARDASVLCCLSPRVARRGSRAYVNLVLSDMAPTSPFFRQHVHCFASANMNQEPLTRIRASDVARAPFCVCCYGHAYILCEGPVEFGKNE